MVLSSMVGTSTPKVVELPKAETSSYKVVKEISTKDVENMMGTEEYVRQYFSDIPIMIQIARCESTFKQLDSDGEIKRGIVNSADVGVMQINEFYHLNTAVKKNYNLYTVEGNTAYARDLYERQGTQPWSSSKPCWGKYATVTNSKDLAMNVK